MKKIEFSTARMRQIARYEATFKDIIDNSSVNEYEMVFPEVYRFTLDDLYHAILGIKEADPTIGEFERYWFDPIYTLSDAFDLDRACGYSDDFDDTPEYLKGYPGLIVSDSRLFSDLWEELDIIRGLYDGEKLLSDVLSFDAIISDFKRYFDNKGKPVEEMVFSTDEIKSYIAFFENDKFVKEAGEPQLALARKFIEELCGQDDELALRVKGYACYGGNRLYPCDWNISREYMHRLFDKNDDPNYANTLGYIYYYGRCNGGVPEYDKAFRYFSFAAANGLYEGMYKLADMYRQGYGCKESQRTARTLYGMVYADSIKKFLKGDDANFADAALRMGHVYADGVFEKADIIAAYHYYLQAEYAAKIRAAKDDFFGYKTVYNNAHEALERTRARLPEDYLAGYLDYEMPYLFGVLAEDNHKCELTKIFNAGGHTDLLAKRIPTQSVPEPEDVLVTIERLSLCLRTDMLSYTIDDDAEIFFKDDADLVRFDYCVWNKYENRYEFYNDGTCVAWSKSGNYRLYAPPGEKGA